MKKATFFLNVGPFYCLPCFFTLSVLVLKFALVPSAAQINIRQINQHNDIDFTLHVNPFPNKPWFLRVCCTSLLKTMWEKEKLLVTSNFSISHSVFYLFGEFSAIFINLKLSSANSFSLKESKICCLEKC